jgi:hypothetical protein
MVLIAFLFTLTATVLFWISQIDMDTRLRKVENEDELHNKIDDYQIQGFHILERSDTHAKLRNSKFGTFGMHVLFFLLTFWFTLGLGNIAYLIYAYVSKSNEVLIKVES